MFQIMPRRTLTWVKKRIEQTSFEDQPILPALEIRYFTRFSAYFGGNYAFGAVPTAHEYMQLSKCRPIVAAPGQPCPDAGDQPSLQRTEWQNNRNSV
ncbi:hypothetical protein [Ruegeria sp. HKCCA0235A]|uniref:hypothetical protein n=1 Tax=Ruegeria sp. HKCCA0235A TaxID=2682998 RepID=UPI001487910E|nr:hypothetical protein [Ruegeria sp. HKCCA0235A]